MSPVWSCLAIAQPLPARQKRWYVLAVIVSPLSSRHLDRRGRRIVVDDDDRLEAECAGRDVLGQEPVANANGLDGPVAGEGANGRSRDKAAIDARRCVLGRCVDGQRDRLCRFVGIAKLVVPPRFPGVLVVFQVGCPATMSGWE